MNVDCLFSMEPSRIQQQNVTRLKVNRIALIQTLNVNHILDYLTYHGVLNEHDSAELLLARTGQDKVRTLLDILPTKGKQVDWYARFRSALQNPNVNNDDTKKKYQILVEFLDNTIIHMPRKTNRLNIEDEQTKKAKVPFYENLPDISRNQTALETQLTFTITGKEQAQRPQKEEDKHEEHHHELSVIQLPEDLMQTLAESEDMCDQDQFKDEQVCFTNMKYMEALLTMHLDGKVSLGSKIVMSSVVDDFLTSKDRHHLYYKYIEQLEKSVNENLLIVLGKEYCSYLESEHDVDEIMTQNYVDLGYGLADFMFGYGLVHVADEVLNTVLRFLSANLCLSNWMATWEGTVRLMEINNFNADFEGAQLAHKAAQNVAHHIKMMAFGQTLIDKAQMSGHLCNMMLERGNISEGFVLAQTALKV